MLDRPFPQPFSRSSLVFLLFLDPLLHTPYIPSFHITCPYYRSLFCCHLFLIALSAPYLEICFFTLMPYINLTILISARWSATSFLSLQARSHFHATYCFAHNCYTSFLSNLLYYVHKLDVQCLAQLAYAAAAAVKIERVWTLASHSPHSSSRSTWGQTAPGS